MCWSATYTTSCSTNTGSSYYTYCDDGRGDQYYYYANNVSYSYN